MYDKNVAGFIVVRQNQIAGLFQDIARKKNIIECLCHNFVDWLSRILKWLIIKLRSLITGVI